MITISSSTFPYFFPSFYNLTVGFSYILHPLSYFFINCIYGDYYQVISPVNQLIDIIIIIIRLLQLIISIIIWLLLPVFSNLSGHHTCAQKILLFFQWKNGEDLITCLLYCMIILSYYHIIVSQLYNIAYAIY